MVIPFRSVDKGLAAFAAPDHTLLPVFEVMVEEFLNVIESLTIWYSYTPEHKLHWEETMIRLSILSFDGFYLLSRRITL